MSNYHLKSREVYPASAVYGGSIFVLPRRSLDSSRRAHINPPYTVCPEGPSRTSALQTVCRNAVKFRISNQPPLASITPYMKIEKVYPCINDNRSKSQFCLFCFKFFCVQPNHALCGIDTLIVDIKILSPPIKTHYFVVFACIKSYFSQIFS